MPDSVPSNPPPKSPDLSHYKPQYKIDVEQWKKYLHFPHTELSNQEVHAIADGMIKFMLDCMNRMMQQALEQMKEREKREKEDKGG